MSKFPNSVGNCAEATRLTGWRASPVTSARKRSRTFWNKDGIDLAAPPPLTASYGWAMEGVNVWVWTSEPEETVHLDHKRLVPQARVPRHGGVPFVRVDDEDLAAGLVLPAEPEVAAEGVVARVELHQRAEEPQRREGVVHPGAHQRGGELAGRQVPVVE